jgi:hypothetical protein
MGDGVYGLMNLRCRHRRNSDFQRQTQFQYLPGIIVTAELKRFARRFCLLSKPDYGLASAARSMTV